jgi:mono/diheme cytochrome c family protein
MNARIGACRGLVPALLISLLVTIVQHSFACGSLQEAKSWTAPSSASRKKNPVTCDDKSIGRGRAMYARECRACHGSAGHGDGSKAAELRPRPTDLTSPRCSEQPDGALFWKISEGRKSMPGFDGLLETNERWDVVNYLRSLAPTKKAGVQTTSNNSTVPGTATKNH